MCASELAGESPAPEMPAYPPPPSKSEARSIAQPEPESRIDRRAWPGAGDELALRCCIGLSKWRVEVWCLVEWARVR